MFGKPKNRLEHILILLSKKVWPFLSKNKFQQVMCARKNMSDIEFIQNLSSFILSWIGQNPQGQPRGGVLLIFSSIDKTNQKKNMSSFAWSGIRTHASLRIEDLKSSALTDSAIHACSFFICWKKLDIVNKI